jgi:hypothetical protein
MAFDFPANPTNGQIFNAGAISYTWDGQKWVLVPPSEKKTALVNNLIVNPGFQISQENAQGTNITTTGKFVADQWTVDFSGMNIAIINEPSPAVVSWQGGQIHIQSLDYRAALAATDHLEIRTKLEGKRVQQWLAGGYPNPSVLHLAFSDNIGGKYGFALRRADGVVVYLGQFTSPGGSEITVVDIPIPTQNIGSSGSWLTDTSASLEIIIVLAAGANYLDTALGWRAGGKIAGPGQVNWYQMPSADFWLYEVAFYTDPLGTGKAPPFQVPDYDDDLRDCKRYWQKTTAYLACNVTSGSTYYLSYKYTVPTRTTPTLSGVNVSSSGFPSTVGTLTDLGINDGCVETLPAANATGACVRRTDLTVNARM